MSKNKLQMILTRRLKLKRPRFLLKRDGKMLIGSVISETFAGKRGADRQGMIWDALEAELGPEADRSVGMALAYTPEEWDWGAIGGRTYSQLQSRKRPKAAAVPHR